MTVPADITGWVLPRILAARARATPDAPFLQAVGEAPTSFAEMEARSGRLAAGLRRLGIGPGDTVLVMLGNEPLFVALWFAICRVGAILVPVNTALKGDFLSHVARDSGATLAVVAAASKEALLAVAAEVPALARLVVVDEETEGAVGPWEIAGLAALEAAPEAGDADASVAVSDIAAIMYTSGTTGRSKGVRLPYGHLHLNPHIYIERLGLTSEDVIYTCLPLFHANGLLLGVYAGLILGARVVLAKGFSASRWAEEIRASGATVTNLLGVMADFVLLQPPRETERGALRQVVAVPFRPDQAAEIEARFGARVGTLYGSTELNCPIYRRPGEAGPEGSCGRIVAEWFEIRLADPETDLDVPDGCPGELLVRPRAPWTTMAGYHGLPEATLAAWRNLWFHTGDVMRRDPDGHLFYLDRLKDCIRRRGENVSAAEVEAVLARHPAVAEVAVIGIPSPVDTHEQEVMACLVLREGEAVAPEALFAFCRDRMPDYALPRFIEVYERLPKTATEKISKADLRARGLGEATWRSPAEPRRKGRAA